LFVFFVTVPSYAEEGFLETSDGVQLFYEHLPADSERGIAILLHGYGMRYNEWALLKEFLSEREWSTLAIDFRGNGASMEGKDRVWDWMEFGVRDWLLLLKDIDAAVKHAQEISPSNNIWLIGSSLGANLALNYAAKASDLSGIVLLSPSLNYLGIRTEKTIVQLSKPVLMIASQDDKASFSASQKLIQMAKGKKKLIRLKQVGHGNEMIAKKPVLKEAILQWMSRFS